ncbi:MAG TPA: hypothetical protein VGC11_09455 [Acidimicrobiia bacterium]
MSAPPWRVALAALLLVVLAAAVVRFGLQDGGQGGATTTHARALTQAPTVTTSAPPGTDEPTSAAPAPEAEVVAAEAALAAWGGFAVSGDLAVLAGFFDPAGPQYQQAKAEAPERVADELGPPPYVFRLEDVEVIPAIDDQTLVDASVVMTRPGEDDQHFTWRLHLTRRDGTWLLWTIEDIG